MAYWKNQNVDLDTIRCNGCRSDRDEYHWAPDCPILDCCVYQKHLSYCSECSDFPCKILEKWGAEYNHHAKAVERLSEMKKEGTEKWLITHGYE